MLLTQGLEGNAALNDCMTKKKDLKANEFHFTKLEKEQSNKKGKSTNQ